MTGNDFVKFFLRTPFYIFMGDTMLITVTGCKSGKKYTTPVGFYRDGDFLWILSSRDRTWWRNVKDGGDVEIRIHGKDVKGFAKAVLDEDSVAKQVEIVWANTAFVPRVLRNVDFPAMFDPVTMMLLPFMATELETGSTNRGCTAFLISSCSIPSTKWGTVKFGRPFL